MSDAPIANVGRITWSAVTTDFGELVQMSVHTSARASGNWAALLAKADLTWVNNLGGLLNHLTATRVSYSEYGAGPDFTGWHQKASIVVSHASNSGNPLPPQCACVVSFLNATDLDKPIRTRRGRIFHGPVSATSIGSDGRFTSTFTAGLVTAYQAVNTDLKTIPGIISGGAADGIILASPFLGLGIWPVQIGVGRAVDTQRRRRNKVTEAISYVNI